MDRIIDLYEDEIDQLLYVLKNTGNDNTRLYNKINQQLTPTTDIKAYRKQIRNNEGIIKPTKDDFKLYKYEMNGYENTIKVTYDNGLCGTGVFFILDMMRYINIGYLLYIHSIGYDENILKIELSESIEEVAPWVKTKYRISKDGLMGIVNTIIQSEHIQVEIDLVKDSVE